MICWKDATSGGLATDIELLDVFPNSYIAWWSRQHCWIRGDWQVIDWLKSRVPVGGGRMEPNRSAFNHGRSSTICAGVCATSDHSSSSRLVLHTCSDVGAIIAGLMLWPVLNAFLAYCSIRRRLNEILARPARPALRVMLTVIFWRIMRHGARCHCSRDHRRITSHRLLLEWETRQTLTGAREVGNCNLFLAGFGFPLPACLSARRCGNRKRWWPPPFLPWGSLSGGGNGDQSASEELAWRNANVG
jgi:hypothetical protein